MGTKKHPGVIDCMAAAVNFAGEATPAWLDDEGEEW